MNGWRWPIGRKTALFLLGFGGLIHEAFIWDGPPRYEWIVVFSGLCGLPVPMSRDEARADVADEAPADASA